MTDTRVAQGNNNNDNQPSGFVISIDLKRLHRQTIRPLSALVPALCKTHGLNISTMLTR